MKVKISYHSVQSDHVLAVPEFTHFEIVEVGTGLHDRKLVKYICSKKDEHGHQFEESSRSQRTLFGFEYISKQGGVKVDVHIDPPVKRL